MQCNGAGNARRVVRDWGLWLHEPLALAVFLLMILVFFAFFYYIRSCRFSLPTLSQMISLPSPDDPPNPGPPGLRRVGMYCLCFCCCCFFFIFFRECRRMGCRSANHNLCQGDLEVGSWGTDKGEKVGKLFMLMNGRIGTTQPVDWSL